MITEKQMEDLIASKPESFIEEGLKLEGRQVSVGNCRFDLLFTDRLGRKVLVEIKKGTLSRDHVGQIIEYYGAMKKIYPMDSVDLLIIANIIPPDRKMYLERMGINFLEIHESKFLISDTKNFNLKNMAQESLSKSDVFLIFALEDDRYPKEGVEHLKNNNILCLSLSGYVPKQCMDLSYPIKGLIYITSEHQIRFECLIEKIERYQQAHNKDTQIKPSSWIQENSTSRWKDKLKESLFISKIFDSDCDWKNLQRLDGKNYSFPRQAQLVRIQT